MKRELSIKQIYNDFVDKVFLNDTEKKVLELYVKNETIVKISDATNQSTSSVSRIIYELKIKYNNYKKLEISKLNILNKK